MAFILLYDGECSYCQQLARKIEKLDKDKKFRFDNLHSHVLINQSISLEKLQKDIHVLGPNDEIWVGAAAIEKIIKELPQTAFLRKKMIKQFTEKVSNRLYQFLQWRRSKSKCKACD